MQKVLSFFLPGTAAKGAWWCLRRISAEFNKVGRKRLRQLYGQVEPDERPSIFATVDMGLQAAD